MNPVDFFKCLADDTRLQSLLLIRQEGELCVCELMAALQESQPKISRHLAQLRQCNILQDRRAGQWVYYRLHDDLPAWALEVISQCAAGNADYLATGLHQLCNMGERPARKQGCC